MRLLSATKCEVGLITSRAVTRNFLLGGGTKQYWGAQQRRRQDFGLGIFSKKLLSKIF